MEFDLWDWKLFLQGVFWRRVRREDVMERGSFTKREVVELKRMRSTQKHEPWLSVKIWGQEVYEAERNFDARCVLREHDLEPGKDVGRCWRLRLI